MGEHLLRILLSELSTIRVRCAGCKTTVEIQTDAAGQLDNAKCPGCDKRFGYGELDAKAKLRGNAVDRLEALARAVEEIQKVENLYTVEFPIRLDGRE